MKKLKPIFVNGWWLHFDYNGKYAEPDEKWIVYVGGHEDDDMDADFLGLFASKKSAVEFVQKYVAKGNAKR